MKITRQSTDQVRNNMKIELRNDRHRFGAEHEMKMGTSSQLFRNKKISPRERETVEEGDETNKNDRTQRSKHASYMSQFSQ